MIIRGAMNKTVASGLKYTSEKNQWLVEHYRNYPKDHAGFEEWNSCSPFPSSQTNAGCM